MPDTIGNPTDEDIDEPRTAQALAGARVRRRSRPSRGCGRIGSRGAGGPEQCQRYPIAFACVVLALSVALWGLVHRGVVRVLGPILAVALASASVGLLVGWDSMLAVLVAGGGR